MSLSELLGGGNANVSSGEESSSSDSSMSEDEEEQKRECKRSYRKRDPKETNPSKARLKELRKKKDEGKRLNEEEKRELKKLAEEEHRKRFPRRN